MGRRLGRRRKRTIVIGGVSNRRAYMPYAVQEVAAATVQVPAIDKITEQEARALLEKIVWPNGPRCDCGNAGYGEFYDRNCVRVGAKICKRCKSDVSVRTGTAMAYTKLPLKTWVKAMHLLTKDPNIRECDFTRALPQVDYKSAGLMRKRLLADERLMRGFQRVMR